MVYFNQTNQTNQINHKNENTTFRRPRMFTLWNLYRACPVKCVAYFPGVKLFHSGKAIPPGLARSKKISKYGIRSDSIEQIFSIRLPSKRSKYWCCSLGDGKYTRRFCSAIEQRIYPVFMQFCQNTPCCARG